MKSEASLPPIDPPHMSTGNRILWAMTMIGPAIYLAVQGDYVTAFCCFICFFAGLAGYRAGLLASAASLLAVVAALRFAPDVAIEMETQVSRYAGTTGLTNRVVSLGLAGFTVTLLAFFALLFMGRRVIGDSRKMLRGNRIGGFVLGLAQAGAAILLFLGGVRVIQPIIESRLDPDRVESVPLSISVVSVLSDQTRQSWVGPIVTRNNPFTKWPQLNRFEEIQQTAAVLADGSKIERVLRQPSVRRLSNRPEVKQAIEDLRSDPEIGEALREGTMNRRIFRRILDHPATLRLVDDPEFVNGAREAIRDLSHAG